MIPVVVFCWNLIRPMLRNSPWTLIMSTAVCDMHPQARFTSQKAEWTNAKTFCQCVSSGDYSWYSALSHIHRCSARMPDGPLNRFYHSCRNSQATLSSYGTESSMGKRSNTTGMVRTGGGGGSLVERSLLLHDPIDGDADEGGDGRSTTSLYQPHICIHASFTRGRLDARRYSTAVPASAACCLWYS